MTNSHTAHQPFDKRSEGEPLAWIGRRLTASGELDHETVRLAPEWLVKDGYLAHEMTPLFALPSLATPQAPALTGNAHPAEQSSAEQPAAAAPIVYPVNALCTAEDEELADGDDFHFLVDATGRSLEVQEVAEAMNAAARSHVATPTEPVSRAFEQPWCRGCGNPLLLENAWMYDGCPCNSPDGTNDGNPYRWRLLWQKQQEDSRQVEVLSKELERLRAKLVLATDDEIMRQESALRSAIKPSSYKDGFAMLLAYALGAGFFDALPDANIRKRVIAWLDVYKAPEGLSAGDAVERALGAFVDGKAKVEP